MICLNLWIRKKVINKRDAFVRASDRLSLNSWVSSLRIREILSRNEKTNTYELDQIDDWHLAFLVVLRLGTLLVANQRPQLVQIDGRTEVVIAIQMEVAHTELSEVTGMVLVHVDSVMVHATSVTATTGMLTVLS